mgnify:CR=1 FL=1
MRIGEQRHSTPLGVDIAAVPPAAWVPLADAPTLLAYRGERRLVTLQHAADYIMKLPEDVQQHESWQIAVENLINAAEAGGGWLMFARIGVMRALNGDGKER